MNYNILEFTEYPGPRYISQGEYSGELLYKKHLKKLFQECVNNKTVLTINLDGTAGYAASFIDEVFGNIVYDFGSELFEKYIVIISDDEPEWKIIIKEIIKDWQIKREKKIPRKPLNE